MPTLQQDFGGDHRHLLLLEEVEGQKNVSQRKLAERLGMALSQVNRLLGELLEAGHVEVVDRSVRPYAYRLSSDGHEYRRMLSHRHFRSVVGTFREVQDRIRQRLVRAREDGVIRVVFYGTGDVMEVTYPLALAIGLEVLGLVDDDPAKQGKWKGDLLVHSPGCIEDLEPDAVVITTFRHAGEIQRRIGAEGQDVMRVVEL